MPDGPAFCRGTGLPPTIVGPTETKTAGKIAKAMHQPTASRAVGMANNQNPIVIIVPCHRIVGANGSLTGYGGGLPRKKWLLQHEATHGARTRQLPELFTSRRER